jgi:hypothetical protein
MTKSIGLSPYQGGQGARRPGPRQVFETMLEKARLRTALETGAARIQEALPYLNADETEQLKGMLADEAAPADVDAAHLRAAVDREAALAGNVRAMNVKIGREASLLLQREMMRRVQGGVCPPPAALAAELPFDPWRSGLPLFLGVCLSRIQQKPATEVGSRR